MDAATSGLIGAAIGGGVTLIANLISIWQQARSMRNAKLASEEAWLREKLHEIYVNCIYFVGTSKYEERNKWINLLLIYHPERSQPTFSEFLDKHTKGALAIDDIIALAARDSRIQGVSYQADEN
ncbi:hypothetical protein [Iodobacter fluviatilis]|uniref:Uncharacterized protein n=1 Tax=Iodobacter fluviatilis TaxID=537 RepID=A0A377Q8S1_9NEIS|nr:hypothetical protein [Iodobacter fluviatilis]TCU82439.1 hypothetical protein EV682_11578 [Iodobacter fluviatilis]STQ91664.1 Uncharacterised protein [Iodobacter fluviatilis]